MSGEIFIEADKARSFGLPVSEHLYLVFRDTNGDEYVLRSGPASKFWPFGDMQIEANVPMADSADDRDGETPRERSSTALDFPDATDDRAWAIMVKYAQRLERADYQYDLLNENSNAFVGALLHAAGGEPEDLLPVGIDSREAVGFTSWRDIVEDVTPPSDWIFRGTAGRDHMVGLQIDEEIRTFGGDDRVTAGRGNDIVLAGSGNDQIWGEQGNDRLVGGAGADVLKGGSGNDLLTGGSGDDRIVGGRGNDHLVGGPGSDLFAFEDAGRAEVDRIADFDAGTDLLRFSGIDDAGQIALGGGTRDGNPFAELEWGDHRLRLVGLDADDLTTDSFAFA